MIIDIAEILEIRTKKNNYYFALLKSNQLIYLINKKEITQLIKDLKKFTQQFSILNKNVYLTRWKLNHNIKNAIPMNDILDCARILILDNLKFYPLMQEYLENINIIINKNWIMKKKEDFFHYAFTCIYENWYNPADIIDYKYSEKKIKLYDNICKELNRNYSYDNFQDWIENEDKFILKVVGEKYHMTIQQLKKIKKEMKINLLTDASNCYDNKAISVFLQNGKQIGFIRKPAAHKLYYRLINSQFKAKIVFSEPDNDNNKRILIELRLES